MKKLLLLLLLSLSLTAYPQEVITEFSEETLPVLNEELRQQEKGIEHNETDITTNETNITTNETDITTINNLIATTATANSIYQSGADKYLPDATVDTTALKTATGEVSATNLTNSKETLPGGTYGFYPQTKQSIGANSNNGAKIFQYGVGLVMGTTYATHIVLQGQGSGGQVIYAQQRYVTASGTDWFVFIVIDKQSKEIKRLYSSSDHPSYGAGGDYEKVPHPFSDVDLNKYEIILLDKETIKQLQSESTDIDEATGDKRLATLINKNYKINLSKELPYIPLHSGKYKRILKNGKEVVTKQIIKTIPNYIKVRKLVKLTQQEKDAREVVREAERIVLEQEEAREEQDKTNAKNKLEVLGLSKEEVELLFN